MGQNKGSSRGRNHFSIPDREYQIQTPSFLCCGTPTLLYLVNNFVNDSSTASTTCECGLVQEIIQNTPEEDWVSTEALDPPEEAWCHAEKWLEHQSAAQLTPGTLTDGQHARAGIQSNVFDSNTTEGNLSCNQRGGNKNEKEAEQ